MLRPVLKRPLIFLTAMAALNVFVFCAQVKFVRAGYSDFMHFYATGKLVRSGHGAQIWDAGAQLEQQKLISEAVRSTGVPVAYMHPPFEALLFAAFASLPYHAAYWAWAAMNLAALLAVMWMLRHELPALRELPGVWFVVLPLAFYPVMNSFAEGQDDILLLGLFALAFVALRRKAEWWAGICLGLGMIRPQFAVPLLAITLFAGQWRVAAGFLIAVAGLAAVTAAVFGWQMVVEYPRHLLAAERGSYVAQTLVAHMPNLHGLIAATLAAGGAQASAAMTAIVVALSLAAIGLAVWVWRERRTQSPESAFAVAVLAVLLVSYHSFVHDLSLLLLVIMVQANWLLARTSRPALARWRRVAVGIPMLVLLLPPVALWMVLHRQFHWYALGLGAWLAASVCGASIESHPPGTGWDVPPVARFPIRRRY